MSTYTDKHCMIKENVAVDYHNRTTCQQVKFKNDENEYWGTFHGIAQISAFIPTTGLKLKHEGYDSIADLFDDGTGKCADHILKAHEVWRLVQGHNERKTYIVDGLTIDVGDIFIVKKDIKMADLTIEDLDFIHLGGSKYKAGKGLELSNYEFAIQQSVFDDIDNRVKINDFNGLSVKVDGAIDDISALQSSLAETNDKLSDEETRAKDAEKQLTAAIDEEKTERLDKEVAIDAELASVNGEIGELKIRAGNIETRTNAVESAINALDNIKADKVELTAYIPLSAANQDVTEDNKVATMADIDGLSGVLHFRGTFTNDESALSIPDAQAFINEYKPVMKGDIAINTQNAKEYIAISGDISTPATSADIRELGDESTFSRLLEEERNRAINAENAINAKLAAIKSGLDECLSSYTSIDDYEISSIAYALSAIRKLL